MIVAVMMMVIAGVAIFGVTTFLLQRSKYSLARSDSFNAKYLAQAGVHWAVYQYRQHDLTTTGYFSLGQQNVDGNTFMLTSNNQADLLMVNTRTTSLNPNGRRVQNFQLQNATNTINNNIVVTRMIVSWTGGGRLQEIRLNNLRLWTGNALSPVNADLSPDFTLVSTTPPILYSGTNNRLIFSIDKTGSTVDVQFILSDGSIRSETIFSNPSTNKFNFWLNSKGQIAVGGINKTIRAEYNANTAKLSNYYEIP